MKYELPDETWMQLKKVASLKSLITLGIPHPYEWIHDLSIKDLKFKYEYDEQFRDEINNILNKKNILNKYSILLLLLEFFSLFFVIYLIQ